MKRFKLLFAVLFLAVYGLANVAPALNLGGSSDKAFAAAIGVDPSATGVVLFVTLGSGQTSGATVTATQKVNNNGATETETYNFQYSSLNGQNGYINTSDPVQFIGTGGNCSTDASYNEANQITVNANQGSSKGSTLVNTCSYATKNIYGVAISLSSNNTQTAGIKGTLQYVSDNNGTLPIQSSATGTLVGPGTNGQTYALSFDDNGNIAGPAAVLNNLPPGSYTLTVNYTPTDPADGNFVRTETQTFTLAAGETKDISATIADPNPRTGGGSTTVTCSDGSLAANQNACPTAAQSTTQATCESDVPGLGWMICSIIDGISTAEEAIVNDFLDPFLETPTINFVSCTSTNPPTPANCDPTDIYAVWSNFRLYGDIFLVIALLAVVFGEAIGGGLIDAYTAKKMLPRILAAAILINLSIYIVALGIDITNILGKGIESLITAPLASANHGLTISLGAGVSGASIAGLFVGGAAIWAGGIAGIGYIALTVLLPLILASVGVIITLLLRRAILLFLVFVAPIAFALYVLPNTEKYFRRWWDLLFKTLLVYPLVGVFFAMATVMGVILNAQTQPTTGATGLTPALGEILSVVALVIPLFLIPYSFRLAGGIIGTLHEQVENHRKRAHGLIAGDVRNPASIQNQLKSRAAIGRNQRFFTGAAIGQVANPLNWRKNKVTGVGGLARVRGSLEERRTSKGAILGAQLLENNAISKANINNDKYQTAVGSPQAAGDRLKKANDDVGAAEELLTAARLSGNQADISDAESMLSEAKMGVAAWHQAINAASLVVKNQPTQLAATQAWAASGYNFAPGRAGYNELAEAVAAATGAKLVKDRDGNVMRAEGPSAGTYANAMNQAQYNLKNSGMFHLAGINNGAGYDPEMGIKKADPYTMATRGRADAITEWGQVMRSQVTTAQRLQNELPERIAQAIREGKPNDVARLEKQVADAWQTASITKTELSTGWDSATGKNKDAFTTAIQPIPPPKENTPKDTPEARSAAARDAQLLGTLSNYERSPHQIREDYDPAIHPTWPQADRNRGYRMVDETYQTREGGTVTVTNGMVARQNARGSRRPNPSELQDQSGGGAPQTP